MRNFYISDLHLGHRAILNLDHRPFSDLQQMEDYIVMSWNATVHKDDMVYILGDFCWDKADEWVRLLKRLKGQKVLIAGNHDLKEPPAEVKNLFLDIKPYKEIQDGEKRRKVILSHYPILFYKHSNDPDYYMLCGHVHQTPENDYLEKFIQEMKEATAGEEGVHFKNCAQIYNVGAMMPWMQYTPRTLDEIIRNKGAWETTKEPKEWTLAEWGSYKCPKCGKYARENEYSGEPQLTNYCPECGQRLNLPLDTKLKAELEIKKTERNHWSGRKISIVMFVLSVAKALCLMNTPEKNDLRLIVNTADNA